MKPILLGLALLCLAPGCTATGESSSPTPAVDETTSACNTDSDCTAPHHKCGFKIVDGCAAKGVCVQTDGSGTCDAAARQICACDGKTEAIQYGCDLPKGYEQQLVSHEGACETSPSQ